MIVIKKPGIYLTAILIVATIKMGMCVDVRYGGLSITTDRYETDINRLTQLLDSADLFFEGGDYARAIDLGKKCLELAEESMAQPIKIRASLLLARAYNASNIIGSTLEYYLQVINGLESEQDSLLLPEIYLEIGDYYDHWGLQNRTLEYYFKAFRIIEPTERTGLKMETLRKIAELNRAFDYLNEAALNYDKLRALYYQAGEDLEVASIYQTMSEIYLDNKMYDDAIRCSKEACLIHIARKDTLKVLATLSDIGQISYRNNNPSQAVDSLKRYFSMAEMYFGNIKNSPISEQFVHNLIIVGTIYQDMTDKKYLETYDLADHYFNQALSYTDPGKLPALYSEALNKMGIVQHKKNNYKQALYFLDLAIFYGETSSSYDQLGNAYLQKASVLAEKGKHQEAYISLEKYNKTQQLIHQRKLDEFKHQYLMNRGEEVSAQFMEQREEMISQKERQELALQKLQLQAKQRDQDLMLLQQDKDLQKALFEKELLEKDKLQNEKQLLAEQLKATDRQNQLEILRRDQERNESMLKLQEAERKLTIERLQKEKADAELKQQFYILSIVLISIALISILYGLIQKQRNNRKLKSQKYQIEHQASQLKSAYQNLEMLNLVGREITSNLLIDSITDVVYENVNKIMDASVFGIGIYVPASNSIQFKRIMEKGETYPETIISLNNRSSLAALCFNEQREIVIHDFFRTYQNYIGPVENIKQGDGNATSIIYLPLTSNNIPLGVLTVQSFKKEAFSNNHLNLVRSIATYVKIAMENARAYEEIAEKSETLKAANRKIRSKNALIEKQNQQLISINKEKNHLIGILAHDLRNPLSMSMSMTEFIQVDKTKLSDEQLQASQIIWKALNRMNDMIAKILDVKAIESNQINLEMEQLDLREVVERCRISHEEPAGNKNITISTRIDTEARIIADGNYLVQVVDNLLSNAIKFSLPGSSVYITIRELGEQVRLEIRDEGPGLSSADMKKLFGKYQKLSARPTGGEQSTGLGLSIVKKYVELMDGKVWCKSKPGKGAVFYVAFDKCTEPVV